MLRSILIFFVLLFAIPSTVMAGVDLRIQTFEVSDKGQFFQFVQPTARMVIRNMGTTPALGRNIGTGWISCKTNTFADPVYVSSPISTLVINSKSDLTLNAILLSDAMTQILGSGKLTCTVAPFSNWTLSVASMTTGYSVTLQPEGRFDMILGIVKKPIEKKLDAAVPGKGISAIQNWFWKLIDVLVIPGLILVCIFMSILGLFDLMTESGKDDIKKPLNSLKRCVIAIVLIVSARWMAGVIDSDILNTGINGAGEFNLIQIINKFYDLLLYPILKVGFYVAMAFMFVMVLMRGFEFVTSKAEETRAKAGTLILNTVMGLMIIIGSKQIVELIYGKEANIRNGQAVTISDIGGGFLSDRNIPILYTIIQWIAGIAGFVILVLILVQTFTLLTNPSDEKALSNIGKTLGYALLGLITIGLCYLIVNVVMIQ